MASVVAVVGTIAGAGTTTVVTALGTALGEQRRQVAVVDATAEGSRITDAIGVEGDGEVTDALRRGTAVPEVQAEAPHDVAAFPAGPETNWGAVRPDAVDDLYDQLRDRFEFVLVDCGNEPSVDRAAWLGHADEVVIVTDPDVADTVPEIVALANALDVPVRGVLASRVPPKEVEDAIEALDAIDQTVLGVLPEDPTVGAAEEAGTSVLRTEPDSPIATSAWEFALRFRQRDHDEPVVPAGTVPDSVGQSDDTESESAEGKPDRESETEAHRKSETEADRESENGVDRESDPETARETAEEPTEAPNDATTAGDAETADESSPGESTTSSDGSGSSSGGPSPSGASSRSSGEDAFETPEPQPVEEGDSESRAHADADDAQPPDGGASGASTPDPSRAASRSALGDDPGSNDSGSGDSDADDSSLVSDLGIGTEDDDDAGSGGIGGGDAGDVDAGGESTPGEGDDESAELSDEEIEAVFQETMQRVKDRRDQEESERDE